MECVNACATSRPWQGLYRDVPFTIEPAVRTGLDMFRATALRGREAALVHYFDQSISVGQCDDMSDALAVALQQRGVRRGDRVALYLQNVPQVLIAILAAWKCGAAIVPCNPMLRERELVKVLTDSGSRVLICQEDLYLAIARGAVPSTPVQHVITTSALEFLDPAGRSRPSWAPPPACATPPSRISCSWSNCMRGRRRPRCP